MNQAYIVLGSNIRPQVNIPKALSYLEDSFTLKDISLTWRTKPIGTKAEDFFNTAVEIETGLDYFLLKEKCLIHIEEMMGRIRVADKNAPRTIDLDIVIFNGKVLEPHIFNLEYLALPLSELLPDLIHSPSGSSLSHIARELHKTGSALEVGKLLPAK